MKEIFINIPSHPAKKLFDISLAGTSFCDGSYRIFRPKSNIFCIEYVLEGVGTVKTKGKTFTAKKGDTYLLLRGERHEYFSSADEPWKKIWVNIEGELVESLVDLYDLRSTTVICCDTSEYIKKMHDILSEKDTAADEMLDRCAVVLHQLFIKLHNCVKSENAGGDGSVSDDGARLKEYIDKNICEDISIDALSKLIYKSPSQTIRIFKRDFGVTPYDYHLKNKLLKAVSFLESTNLSIREIAYYLGFSDEHYFSNIFKKKTGKSPSEYRKKK